jgi:tetratricopeptide (TPR) repeat protein
VATLRYSVSRPVLSLSAAVLLVAAPRAASADEASPPAAMRLPGWIQSIREPDEPAPGQSVTAAETAVIPAAGTDPSPPRILQIADWNDPRPPSPPATDVIPTAGTRAEPPANPTPPATGFRRWISERMASLPMPLAGTPATDPATSVGAATPQPPVVEAEDAAAPTVNAPVAATPDEMPTLSIDPASFRGALPGKTSRAEIEASWGPPEPAGGGETSDVATWNIAPFDRVEVSFAGDTVATIRIKLAEPMLVGDLARQLEIADLRTVAIRDDAGTAIGEVYPERGVILSLEAGTREATAILIEPLDPDSFVLRAEAELDTCSAYALADLQYAIQVDPQHLRAHRMLLTMASSQGRWLDALRLAESASRLEPDSALVTLKHAGVLLALDRPADARVLLERVPAGGELPAVIAAQAARLLGRAALAGKAPDYRTAVEHFTAAIKLAAPLLAKPAPKLQAATREILLDAHLGTALAIAKGTWQQKSRVIPKWITRSEALVKEFSGDERDRQVLELQLCRGALAVAAGSTESVEPLPWVKRMLELHDDTGETVTDPWRRRQIDWEVGQGLADALTAAQIRGDASDMLDNATLTAAYLERGGEHRQLTDGERKELGDLMFRIGILHSLQRGDHATAVTWFDRTVPLWADNERFTRDGELGRLGESYVSMAISYWQVERREDALELSRQGVDLMVTAVDEGQLEERALAVAYGNLATMHAERGDDEQSRNYAEMASRAESAGTTTVR